MAFITRIPASVDLSNDDWAMIGGGGDTKITVVTDSVDGTYIEADVLNSKQGYFFDAAPNQDGSSTFVNLSTRLRIHAGVEITLKAYLMNDSTVIESLSFLYNSNVWIDHVFNFADISEVQAETNLGIILQATLFVGIKPKIDVTEVSLSYNYTPAPTVNLPAASYYYNSSNAN